MIVLGPKELPRYVRKAGYLAGRGRDNRSARARTPAVTERELGSATWTLQLCGVSGDRVCEAGELGLEAEVFADPATVHERVESARPLGVRAVRRRRPHRREQRRMF